jgi:60 kDa SS-A/Ro ribonucleoprotein
MASSYLTRASTPRRTPQTEPIPGAGQVENSAGGYVWQVTPLERLRRFLVLGSEGGSYYAGERKLTGENIDAVRQALDENGVEAVEEIVAISKDGRAPKNDPALYALAIACAHKYLKVRSAAMDAIPEVARTGTHLFHFVEFVEGQRGWGRRLKASVAKWYEDKDPDALAYQLVKYRQRDGWSHADLLRLSPHVADKAHQALYNWVWAVDRSAPGLPEGVEMPEAIQAFVRAQKSEYPQETVDLIKRYGNTLPREALLTEHLNDPKVWEALLDAGMPMTALVRNLPTLTRHGVLAPLSAGLETAVTQLTNPEALQKARVHPLTLLMALATYRSGASLRGSATWQPVAQIVDALDEAFYASFKYVEPTGKRHLIGIDMSGSMTQALSGTSLSVRAAAAALAMVTARTEKNHHIVGFTAEGQGAWVSGNVNPYGRGFYSNVTDSGVCPLPVSPRQRLDDVMGTINAERFGATDCALPMQYALEKGLDVDCFTVLTDSETYFGSVHPTQALDTYRQKTGIDAKLIIVGMVSNGFTIADPRRNDCLDVVGFDTATPQVMADFSAGRI